MFQGLDRLSWPALALSSLLGCGARSRVCERPGGSTARTLAVIPGAVPFCGLGAVGTAGTGLTGLSGRIRPRLAQNYAIRWVRGSPSATGGCRGGPLRGVHGVTSRGALCRSSARSTRRGERPCVGLA